MLNCLSLESIAFELAEKNLRIITDKYPEDTYCDWPRVVVRRASDDPEVRARIAEAALTYRMRIFAGVARAGDPLTNCTKAAIDALESVGLFPDLSGWRTPDELFRSDIWLL